MSQSAPPTVFYGNRKYMDFIHDDYRYQLITSFRPDGLVFLRVWYLQRGQAQWLIGHSWDLPKDMSDDEALSLTRSFLTGEIDLAEYRTQQKAPSYPLIRPLSP